MAIKLVVYTSVDFSLIKVIFFSRIRCLIRLLEEQLLLVFFNNQNTILRKVQKAPNHLENYFNVRNIEQVNYPIGFISNTSGQLA